MSSDVPSTNSSKFFCNLVNETKCACFAFIVLTRFITICYRLGKGLLLPSPSRNSSSIVQLHKTVAKNQTMKFIFVLALVLLVLVSLSGAQKYSQRKRRSKEIEDRISKLDESTKKRISAMKASGMPKEAIAEKIAYETGGKNVAKRIVDALHDEPEASAAKKANAANKPKPAAATPKPPVAKAAPKTATPQKPKAPTTQQKSNARGSARREL